MVKKIHLKASLPNTPLRDGNNARAHDEKSHAYKARRRLRSPLVPLRRAAIRPRLQAFVDNGLPEGVFRAKAVIHLDSPSARYVFQLCGGRVAFESYDGNIATLDWCS
jgi:hypothetical protein